MISLPTKYSTGFSSGSAQLHFLDITCLDSGVTKHLYLSNLPSGSVRFTYSGSVVGQHDQYLAAKIINNGNEVSVDGIGELNVAFDNSSGGTLSSNNLVSVTLLNQGNFVANHSYDFENQSVKIFKTYASTGSITVESDMVKVFDGVINQAYTYDPTQFRLDCVDRRKADERYMPSFYLNSTNCPHIDSNAVNKFVPTMLGDFASPNNVAVTGSLPYFLGHTTIGAPPDAGQYTTGSFNVRPYMVGSVSAAPTLISDIYSGQALVSDSPFTVTGSLFITNDSSKYVAIVSGSQYYTSTGSVGTMATSFNSLIANPSYGEMWCSAFVQGYHPEILDSSAGGPGRTIISWEDVGYPSPTNNYVKDIGDAIDSDLSTYVTVTNASSPNRNFLQVQLGSISEPGTLVNCQATDYAYPDVISDGVDFFIGGIFKFTGGAVGGQLGNFIGYLFDSQDTVNKIGELRLFGATNTLFAQEWGIHAYHIDYPAGTGNTRLESLTWDLLKSIYIAFGPNTSVAYGDGSKKLEIHKLWIRARTRFENQGITKVATYRPPQYSDVPVQLNVANSVPFTDRRVTTPAAWEILGAGISNLYVPAQGPTFSSSMTRSNGHTTSEVIQDPASAVEWLLRNKLNVPTSGIATGSIDLLNNTTNGTRKDWKLAASFLEHKPVTDYINQICYDYHMSLVITQSGQYKLVGHDTVATGSVAYTITANDLQAVDGVPQIFISTTSNDQIVNDINLQWGFDYTLSKTMESTYVSDTNFDGTLEQNLTILGNTGALRNTSYTGWMQDSISRYGTRKQLNIISMFIQDQTTAEYATKKFADWLAFKRLIVNMKCVPNLSIQKLEIGDIIKIQSDFLTSLYSNASQFMIQSINYPPVNSSQEATIAIQAIELPGANTGTPIYTSRFISLDDLVIR